MKDKKTQGTSHLLKHKLTQNCQIAERNSFGHTKKLRKLLSPQKRKGMTKKIYGTLHALKHHKTGNAQSTEKKYINILKNLRKILSPKIENCWTKKQITFRIHQNMRRLKIYKQLKKQ